MTIADALREIDALKRQISDNNLIIETQSSELERQATVIYDQNRRINQLLLKYETTREKTRILQTKPFLQGTDYGTWYKDEKCFGKVSYVKSQKEISDALSNYLQYKYGSLMILPWN